MKKLMISLLLAGSALLAFSGCSAEPTVSSSAETDSSAVSEIASVQSEAASQFSSEEKEDVCTLTVGGQQYSVIFDDTDAANAVKKLLPLSETFTELNGNEKYYQFEAALPSDDTAVDQIHKGDLMLYQSSYLVLFYKDFTTNYSYTRIGHLENAENLDDVVSSEDIFITIK